MLAGFANRVDGPIVVTHSVHDYAVGEFYPMASLTTNDDAAAFADPLYRYRAFGDDGAQAVPVTPAEELHPPGVPYVFEAGKFLNLNGDRVIKKIVFPSGVHSDIIHEEIAWAAFAAAGLDKRSAPAGTAPAVLTSPAGAPAAGDEGGMAAFPSSGLSESAEQVPREAPPVAPAPTMHQIASKTAEQRLGSMSPMGPV